MKRAPSPAAFALSLVLLGLPACKSSEAQPEAPPETAGPDLTLLFTGNNRGEITQCGCSNGKAGGLARRATLIANESKKGPVLLLDAGGALHRAATLPAAEAGEEALTRAAGIWKIMGELGYGAMTVGPRDLVGGVAPLKDPAGPTALSANLVTIDKQQPFPASKVFKVGDHSVGVIGVSTADPGPEGAAAYLRAGLTADDPVQAAVDAAAALSPQPDLLILLGHLGAQELKAVAAALPQARLLLNGAGGRHTPIGDVVEGALAYEAGGRGLLVLGLDLSLEGPGPLRDQGLAHATETSLKGMVDRVAAMERKVKSGETSEPAQLAALEQAQRQLADAKARAAAALDGSGGEITVRVMPLDETRASDPKIAAQVAALPALDDPSAAPPPPLPTLE